jgi:diaminopimelate epimerase
MSVRKVLHFTKMQGAGNDYVYINGFEEEVRDPAALARAVSDRHFGIGSDGLILILPSSVADLRMRIFNADGGEAEMCGNGIRCVAKYAYEHGICKVPEMRVETLAGVKGVTVQIHDGRVESARVDMGVPDLRRGAIPMQGRPEEIAADVPLDVAGQIYSVTCVSMGNPHCVIFTQQVDHVSLERLGPTIETHPVFPRRINVHFVQVMSRRDVRVRTWERGAGATLACGTGACAVAVAGAYTGRTQRSVTARLPGGALSLEWADSGHVFMAGPAVEVFRGEWPSQ